VISEHLPGHGNRPFMQKKDFLQSLADLPPKHVVAYSMGGRLALEALLYYKAPFLSLTLLSTTTFCINIEERIKKERGWIEALKTLSIKDFVKLWYSQELFNGFTPPLSRFIQNKENLLNILEEYSITKGPCLITNRKKGITYIFKEDDPKGKNLPNTHFVKARSHAIHLECPQQIIQILKTRY
jgi:pimeloyl-ACP methyl ester carboxylesterase